MKVLIDVNVSAKVAEHLRSRGYVVDRASDFLDPRATDEAIVAAACARGAVLVSRDQDFSAIVALSGKRGPSLVNLRTAIVEPARVAAMIASVLERCSEELARGCIIAIDDGDVRIRPLPIE